MSSFVELFSREAPPSSIGRLGHFGLLHLLIDVLEVKGETMEDSNAVTLRTVNGTEFTTTKDDPHFATLFSMYETPGSQGVPDAVELNGSVAEIFDAELNGYLALLSRRTVSVYSGMTAGAEAVAARSTRKSYQMPYYGDLSRMRNILDLDDMSPYWQLDKDIPQAERLRLMRLTGDWILKNKRQGTYTAWARGTMDNSEEAAEKWLVRMVFQVLLQGEDKTVVSSVLGFLHYAFEASSRTSTTISPSFDYERVIWEDFSTILRTNELHFELNEEDDKMLRLLTKDPTLPIDNSLIDFSQSKISQSSLRQFVYSMVLERLGDDCHPYEVGMMDVIGGYGRLPAGLEITYVSSINCHALNKTLIDHIRFGTSNEAVPHLARFASDLGSCARPALTKILSSLRHYSWTEMEALEERKDKALDILREVDCEGEDAAELIEGRVAYNVRRLIRLYTLTEQEALFVSQFVGDNVNVPIYVLRADNLANAIEKYLSE